MDAPIHDPFHEWMIISAAAAEIGVNAGTARLYAMRYKWAKKFVGITAVYAREDVLRTKQFLTDNVLRGRRPKNLGAGTRKRRRQKSE